MLVEPLEPPHTAQHATTVVHVIAAHMHGTLMNVHHSLLVVQAVAHMAAVVCSQE